MKVKINGHEKIFNFDVLTLQELLDLEGAQQQQATELDSHGVFVVAVNFNCIPPTQYLNTVVNNGDDIEIVSPMPGG